jgi:excisionase family DNA binding protein
MATTSPSLLSPREAAEALGASESSLKRWVDAGDLIAQRSAGGHRRIPLHEVVDFARRHGIALRMGTPAVPDDLARRCEELLLDGDGEGLRRLLLGALVAGMPVHALGDGPLRQSMTAIGERWKGSPLGIAEEHLATLLVLRACDSLRLALPAPSPDAPWAVGGAPAGDPYQLPSALAALVLHQAGWNVIDLGADTPAEAVLAAAREHRAALVWRCLSGKPSPDAVDELTRLVQALAPCRLAVGGRSLDAAVPAGDPPGALRCASLADLDRHARSLYRRV